MGLRYHFSMEPDWRVAPVAYWVHVPVAGVADAWMPPAPSRIPHLGYAFLHIEVNDVDLQFSALPQLDHFIDAMQRMPSLTSRQLTALKGAATRHNSHWLSRLSATRLTPPAGATKDPITAPCVPFFTG